MQLGIFAKVFVRPTLEAVLEAVAGHGFRQVQFNFACAGVPSLPDHIPPELIERIRQAAAQRGIRIAAVSGTFNMIHPEAACRRSGLRRLRELASVCPPLGAPVITLCTGTRDPDNLWRRHVENDAPAAWLDLCRSMSEALDYAEEFQVCLGVEPEVTNVVDSARKARRLLDEMKSPRLKIIMDGANLFHAGELPRMREILDETFALLGRDLILAHAKDLGHDGDAGDLAAGTGRLDYDYYLALLQAAGFSGPLILHSLKEEQVKNCLAFLQSKLAGQSGARPHPAGGRS